MKKTLIALTLTLGFGALQAAETKCELLPNNQKKSAYERPKGKGFVAIPVGTEVILTNMLGYRYPCRLAQNAYPYVEINEVGRPVARDLLNGQRIADKGGTDFEVVLSRTIND